MALNVPPWIVCLDEEDLQFTKRFLLASGSLKALAQQYGISYPTVRARMDRLIEKVRVADDASVTDAFQRQLRLLVADGAMDARAARLLLEAHRSVLRTKEGGNHHEECE